MSALITRVNKVEDIYKIFPRVHIIATYPRKNSIYIHFYDTNLNIINYRLIKIDPQCNPVVTSSKRSSDCISNNNNSSYKRKM